MADNYWKAVLRELETGCTCISFDWLGNPRETVCACTEIPLQKEFPIPIFSTELRIVTIRMPSRLRHLLSEFLEVLLAVIQPIASVPGVHVKPETLKSQTQQYSDQVAYMRSVFDPELIEQELRRDLFDPSGLFRSIGLTLKRHCAPMRDHAVEVMMEAAQASSPKNGGKKTDAINTIRLCLEILELMKLVSPLLLRNALLLVAHHLQDIANHQLQTLRPTLIATSAEYERKAFQGRLDSAAPITRVWLRSAHESMLSWKQPLSHPAYPLKSIDYPTLSKTQQTYLAVLKGLTDLIFNPPLPTLSSHHTVRPLPNPIPTIKPLSGYPETTYLDNKRLTHLNADSANAVALSMFLLLYRQLVHSECGEQHTPKIDESELLKLKKEIQDLAAPYPLGYCFTRRCRAGEVGSSALQGNYNRNEEDEKWDRVEQDIVLQVTMRAKEARSGSGSGAHSTTRSRSRSHSSSGNETSPSPPSSPVEHAPDERTLGVAEQWAQSNMRCGSPLSVMVKNRLRDAVFKTLVPLAYPGPDSLSGGLAAIDIMKNFEHARRVDIPLGTDTGMDPMSDEIRSLAERLARLSTIHLSTYIPLYLQPGFLA